MKFRKEEKKFRAHHIIVKLKIFAKILFTNTERLYLQDLLREAGKDLCTQQNGTLRTPARPTKAKHKTITNGQ